MAGEERLSPGKGRLSDLQVAVLERLADVEVLRAGKRFAAAVTNGLYVLEILLKVGICQRLELDELPRAFEVHNLVALLYISGLKKKLERPEFALVRSRWNLLTTNTAAYDLNLLRYQPSAITESDCDNFFQLLFDKPDGVLTWVSSMMPSPGGSSLIP